MHKPAFSLLLGALGGAALGLTAQTPAGTIEVIYTKIEGHPTAIVPGAVDVSGNPELTYFKAHEDIVGSPDGSRWLLRGRTIQPLTHEVILLLGAGTEGEMLQQENQPVPDGEPGVTLDFVASSVGNFNENNDFVYVLRVKGGTANTLQRVYSDIGGVRSEAFRQGSLYFGLLDQFNAPATTAAVGNSVGSAHLLNNGVIGSQDSTILAAPGGSTQLHSSRRPAITYDRIRFHQNGVTQVTRLNGDPDDPLDLETWSGTAGAGAANTFWTVPSADPIALLSGKGERGKGATYIVRGTINQPAGFNNVLVVDDVIVAQHGFEIPGTGIVASASSSTTNPFTDHSIAPNGDWYARGQGDSGTRTWALRNGELFAVTGDTVPGGEEGETWATIIAFTGDRNGNWVMMGKTSNPDATRDDVVVVNGQVILREGDPVLLPGHKGDVFIGRANAANSAFSGGSQVFFAEDGYLYLLAMINDGQGNDYNTVPAFGSPTAFIRVTLPSGETCLGDLDGSGGVDVFDLLTLLGAWGPCDDLNDCPADLNNSGDVDVFDLLILLGAWGECP
jgi:hypothetical protein